MKIVIKRAISLAMCAVLLLGVMSISAFALSAEDYDSLPYKCYTYIGDSISWGYGLDPSIQTSDPTSIGRRIDGSFTDLVGKVLEENNGAEVHVAASSGSRLCDYRTFLEKGMGVENPYSRTDDWFGNRTPERTEMLRSMGDQICAWVRESDLITFQGGINDITALLVNSVCASGLVDIDKITSISDLDSVIEYLQFALGSFSEDPNVLGNIISAFNSEIMGMRENAVEVVKDIVELAPDNADILVVGYSNLLAGLRVLPGTEFSPILDLVGAALVSLNDYYADIAEEYDNVYYVNAPDASVFFPKGMLLTDAITDSRGMLLGLHPDAAGHEYIAKCVLDTLEEINTCRHTNTSTAFETPKSLSGFKYVGSQVCADCGKVLDMGKLVSPVGTFDVPTYTVSYTIHAVGHAVTATAAKIISGLSSIFGRN